MVGIYYSYVGFKEINPNNFIKYSAILNTIALVVFVFGYLLIWIIGWVIGEASFYIIFPVASLIALLSIVIGFFLLIIGWIKR